VLAGMLSLSTNFNDVFDSKVRKQYSSNTLVCRSNMSIYIKKYVELGIVSLIGTKRNSKYKLEYTMPDPDVTEIQILTRITND
jgi:hypothetical protein